MAIPLDHTMEWLMTTHAGMLALSTVGGLLAIMFITQLGAFLKTLIRPNVEHAFYNTLLSKWFGGYFLKRKIIATFIRMNNMGETIINGIIHLIGMFIVVAMLSSALTATILHLKDHDFIFSGYLLFLMSSSYMLTWSLIRNMLYFRKVLYRLK